MVGGWPISDQESAFYQQLFEAVDAAGTGFVGAPAGAALLARSGLPRQVLGKIWETADSRQEGFLSREGFFLALRLVAHAQAGSPFVPALTATEPATLPMLEGFSAPPASASRVSSATSVGWQTTASLSSIGSGIRRPPSFAPSARERRKYASLFLRIDADRDGFVDGAEARELGAKSRLSDAELQLAWNHADQDRDGRLSFPEFVAFVHLITCSTRGLRLPDHTEGPPPQLGSALAVLEPAEHLHGQRSRSVSRSGSEAPSRSVSPAPGERGGGGGEWDSRSAFQSEEWEAGAQDSKARRGRRPPPTIETSESGPRGDGSDAAPRMPPSPESAPRFGAERVRAESRGNREAELETIRRHLRGMLEADRIVRERSQREAGDLEERVRQARGACTKIKPQAAREQDDGRRLADMASQLERQLADAKHRLRRLLEERRSLRSWRRDAERSEDARTFLQRTLEEEGRLLEEMQRSNDHLQQSCQSLSEEMAGFASSRAEVLQQLSAEQELLLRDRARFGAARLAAGESPEMLGLAAPGPAAGAPSWEPRRNEPFSWASTLVVAGGADGGAGGKAAGSAVADPWGPASLRRIALDASGPAVSLQRLGV